MTKEQMKEMERRLRLNGAIEVYLWGQLKSDWMLNTPETLLRSLQTAECVNGSWGGLIYTRDVLAKLADDDWQDAIDEALAEITDWSQAPRAESLNDLVWLCVDHVAAGLGHRLEAVIENMTDEVAA